LSGASVFLFPDDGGVEKQMRDRGEKQKRATPIGAALFFLTFVLVIDYSAAGASSTAVSLHDRESPQQLSFFSQQFSVASSTVSVSAC
jgi:hypothetical protein